MGGGGGGRYVIFSLLLIARLVLVFPVIFCLLAHVLFFLLRCSECNRSYSPH